MPAALMKHDTDPRTEIWNKIGDLTKFQVMHNNVVVAVYERPEKTRSGVFLPDQARDEDRFQGKAALVVAKGPTAFKSSDGWDFDSVKIAVGDWVAIRASDGWNVTVNGKLCRMIPDTAIRAKIASPDTVW